MSVPLEEKLADVGKWYDYHLRRVSTDNVPARLHLQGKAIECLLELLALAAADIQRLEGHKRSNSLWLPNGISVSGDLKRFE
ncbi:MAG: hypothetical protein L0Y56_02280 [Nitrospira sp.]|nr:hypothetical protein [Nitrospira sp.]